MAAMLVRSSKSATILLGKAAAAVKFPLIRSSTSRTPSNSLMPTRSLSHLFTPPQYGFFDPHSLAQYAAVTNFNGVRHYSSRPPRGGDERDMSEHFSSRRVKEGDGSNMSEKRNIWDHKRRLLAAKYEVRRKLHKALCMDPNLPADLREKHRIKLSRLPRNSSFTRIRNHCIISGRARAVYKKFRMSRIVLRDLANKGQLMGLRKASW